MDFSTKPIDAKSNFTSSKTACIVVGIYENKKLTPEAEALNAQGAIAAVLKSGDITGKVGSTLVLRQVAGVAAERVVLVGLGAAPAAKSSGKISNTTFTKVAQSIANVLAGLSAADAIITVTLHAEHLNAAIRSVVLAIRASAYRADGLKSKPEVITTGVSKIALSIHSADQAAAKLSLAQSIALANGIDLTKNLADLPGNFCTPTYLANAAKKIASEFNATTSKISAEILDRKQCQALKMGSFLSVTNGSDEPPKFIVLKHMGGKAKDAPVVLVGKGITFDSGGISLKAGAGMDEMKYDMGGAASVLGTMRAIAELKLKLNVIAVIPSCENMPNGRATKPGDIVTSMSGQTIEILNTDAEGRLILCDALTYAERFNPAAVVDVATLTGACITSLGHHNSGLFTRHDAAHDELANELLAAGIDTGDTAWRMPIGEAYNEQLKSNFADMANIGGSAAGSITAACFLERFTKKYTWAHLDIAGTAWKSGSAKGATGRPVSLLTTFLINRAAN
ncbi:leucyl aminopeptidase [Sapientia aquatica]|uniref:Probable cytosol aminopeptidase n=1 Tax=Sapientia aquatica TaxID=1549640 RepID=A0A4R5W3U8_9BURK|nr:leucyl aminopeptidase [Sapientia aquatica]TDK67005.1 leucyl aminopeptidase [Sapientia aquatica]